MRAFVTGGAGSIRREVIEELAPGVPHDLADLYARLVGERRMIGFEVFQRFYEVGTPRGLAETERYLASR
jgi:NDP-sugar pyrophosphorylase family protein